MCDSDSIHSFEIRSRNEIFLILGFWSSYNIPYFPMISKLSNYAIMEKNYPDANFFSYEYTPRARIFRYQSLFFFLSWTSFSV
jgi:hypothetical protein